MKRAGFLLALLLVALPAAAGCEPGTAFGETDRITVVYTEWYPYTYGDSGNAAGFEIEIVRAVLKDMGVEADFERFPWKRCLRMIEEGKAHALVSMLKTAEREAYANFPRENISLSKTRLFTRSDRDIRYGGDLRALAGKTVGVFAGFSYGSDFDRAAYLQKEEAKNTEALIRKIITGRNDVAAENEVVARAMARKLGYESQIRFLNPPLHTRKLYVGFSKALGTERLAAGFSDALRRFKRTPGYEAILRKYGLSTADMAPERPGRR